jgi:type II secretion system protein G
MKKKGFTLIELLVVIAIIGLLSTLSVVALNSARQKSRDAKRVADVKQIQTALEFYYNDINSYPATLNVVSGGELASGSGATKIIYMGTVPTAPTPFDGTCTALNNPYAYTMQDSGASYTLAYCLGADTGEVSSGVHTANPAGIH